MVNNNEINHILPGPNQENGKNVSAENHTAATKIF